MQVMKVIIDILVYLAVGAGLSWYFYYWRRRDLLGGFAGGLIIAVIGAILAMFLYQSLLKEILEFILTKMSNVNILVALAGGFTALYFFNRINHDRPRSY